MGHVNTATHVEDFLRGANFLSASGGGDPAVEREDLLADVEDGLEIGWVPLDAVRRRRRAVLLLLLGLDRAGVVRGPLGAGRAARRRPRGRPSAGRGGVTCSSATSGSDARA